MQEGPGWRTATGQKGRFRFRNARAGEGLARRTDGCIKAWPEAVDDHEGHQLCYSAPFLPAVKAPQVIRAHDPNESNARTSGDEPFYRVVSILLVNDGFETSYVDTRMMCQRLRGGNWLVAGGGPGGVFEWVAGG